MQRSQIHTHDLNSILSALTPRIQADLPAWYGMEARLAGPPGFQPRDWSFFLRYPVRVSEAERKAILVKIRHSERMQIGEAIASRKMKEEIKDEYESLGRIRAVFARPDLSSSFAAIRPLACYEELNAVVEEEADIRTLKSVFRSPAMWMDGKTRRTFEHYMNLAGRWLRIFHDEIGKADDGPLISEQLYKETLENLSVIQASSTYRDVAFVRERIDGLYEKYRTTRAPYRILHDDFSSANVFVTSDGRICSFDPHNRPGPLYLDLAKIITDLETNRIELLTRGLAVSHSRLETFNASLLKGYFGTESVDGFALNLFRLALLIEKWRDAETRFKEASGVSRFLYSFGMAPMRSFFLQLLRRQVYEQD